MRQSWGKDGKKQNKTVVCLGSCFIGQLIKLARLPMIALLRYMNHSKLRLGNEWGFVVRSVWRGQMSLISSKS